MEISILDPELQEDVPDGAVVGGVGWLGMLGPCLEFNACLANYNLMGCQDAALISGAVN